MDEKIEEMKEIIAKSISDYLEEEGITQLHIKGKKDGTSTKIISNALYTIGYRKESDTAREISTAIKEDKSGYWDSCDCGKEELHWRDKCVEDTLRMISEKYGVDLGE